MSNLHKEVKSNLTITTCLSKVQFKYHLIKGRSKAQLEYFFYEEKCQVALNWKARYIVHDNFH